MAASHHSAKLPAVTVTETNGALKVGGKLTSGAVSVRFSTDKAPTQSNPATTFLLIRLKPGVTPQQAYAGVKPDGSNIEDFGSVQTGVDAVKGTPTKIQTVLQAAQYVAIDPGDSNGSGPHTDFVVSKSSRPATLPKPDATIRMVEYAFHGPTTIKRGALVRTVNAGDEQHMAVAALVPKGLTAKQIESDLRKGQDQKVQTEVKQFGTLSEPVSHGAINQGQLTLKRGTWVLACFMPNPQGVEHTKLGMEKTLIVK